ncbi:hypothetical protein FOL47_008943 [Perkinsus chesapeaki]|uniref:SCP domain-containing protein n=1 Tax=Perkinsus chesapeaki TaxID=330153 RepID=A0A7J6N1U3_PERCH|nr:hypothetical protein FOL47_008943 [Perkinsus chesapeaki]
MLCVLLIVAVLINFCAAVGEGASDNSNERWVNEINLYRCIHGLRPLSWDASLAEAASALANSLSATGSLFIPDPHRNTIAFGFGEFLCSNRYRQFDQTCAVWFWYLQYLDTMGQDGCGHSPIKGKDKWSPSNIADVKILLSDRVEFVGCAGNNLYYACEFDAGCGLPREPCGSNTTELEHCVDETCFWCRENTRVSSCWKWNPYVDLGIWQSTTTTSLPSEPDLEAAVTTTSEIFVLAE